MVHNKFRIKIKIALILAGIIILGIVITTVSIKDKSNELVQGMLIEEVADMLTFTGYDASQWKEILDSTNEEYLSYQDIVTILNKLQILSEESDEYSKIKGNKTVPQDVWFNIFDKIVESLDSENKVAYSELFILADYNNCDELNENEIYSDKGIFEWSNSKDISSYMFQSCKVILFDNNIVYVIERSDKEYQMNNIYFVSGNENGFTIFMDDKYFNYNNRAVENEMSSEIGDIVFSSGEIKQIKMKGDKISGKLLSIQENGLEIEEYGIVPLDENFKLYKEYGQLEEIGIKDLLVGYNVTEFIVANGKISAGLVMKDLVVDNIRVLIKSTGYESLFHDNVVITGNTDYSIFYGEKEEKHAANEEVTIDANSALWEANRIKILPDTLSGEITLLSVQRVCGNPSYGGSIEIVKSDSGLVVINEISMEEYLYMVVPSEMPESYGIEALKAQAVCARTYAYNHILDNAYSQYGAQVDDSVSYQVYCNQKEAPLCTQAVKETYGKVLEKDGTVINTYYFSTSCGHTTNCDIWIDENAEDKSYLQAKFIGDTESDMDLTDEAVFYNFIKNNTYTGYECNEPWYRWTTTIPIDTLSDTLNNRLAARYNANPELVLVKNKKGEFESKDISNIGTIKKITVIHRNEGGVLHSIIVEGSKATIEVFTEYNIRYLLAPIATQVTKSDGSVIDGFSLLPSAYCVMEEVYDNKKLSGIQFTGGGYGHGVGMSQNGAKVMAADNNNYEEILKYFYSGVTINNIYE
ncbi:MAG: SpoIID/LytB domain-containing protein [Lachnotalea sp.]